MPTLDLSQGLSVVIPFYNEGASTPRSVEFVLAALKTTAFPYEIIVVNDGSSDGISQENFPKTVKYLEKNHTGRFETRYVGLKSTLYANVLFVDARVWLKADSLTNLEKLILKYPLSKFWNGFIQTKNTNSAVVSVWETLVMIGWGQGISATETVHFGLDDFDKHPKGTTLFLAPKLDWLNAFESIKLNRSQVVPISDDTKLLRYLVKSGDIWIDSKFSADYQPRTQFSKFIKNAFYRGMTFVDSYWDSPTVFGKLLKASVPIAVTFQAAFYFLFDFRWLVAIDAFLLFSIQVLFSSYSYKKWRGISRAVREGILLLPLFFSFGAGLLLAYAAGLLNRQQKK
jgi:glycosyltransferase involved in cell wall biosynthesis